MITEIQDKLKTLFQDWSGQAPAQIRPLPPSGSARQYFRIEGNETTVLGVHNTNLPENEAYFTMAEHFRGHGLRIPETLAIHADRATYLIQDLGDSQLLGFHLKTKTEQGPSEKALAYYKTAVSDLAQLQIIAGKDLDYSVCLSRTKFDRTAMRWDLDYFKYCFLKLSGLPFDDQLLENAFNAFLEKLDGVDSDYFLFRDFQGRNIMLHEDQPWYIDFQGGKKGPLAYDLASLLYQAKADLSDEVRMDLVDHYVKTVEKMDLPEGIERPDLSNFHSEFRWFALLRIIQTLGAYGYRGFFERKPHFLQSISFAVRNLEILVEQAGIQKEIPALWEALQLVFEQKEQFSLSLNHPGGLLVRVRSFSYKKKGIPSDLSGNGGGFVFDCRGLHNPGRYAPYKAITGLDQPVIEFLEKESLILEFLESAKNAVRFSVENYLERGFSDLMVSFGCTGGQHRSVYCAEAMAKFLNEEYGVAVDLEHVEQHIRRLIPAQTTSEKNTKA